jgi:hypothetical protein
MSTNQDSPEEPQTPIPPRFQFGLSTMFWITTATAIVCALSFTIPADFAIPIMLFISFAVLPAVWTTVIIYGCGYQRTFGIGAVFPSGILVLMIPFGRLGPFGFGGMGREEFVIRLLMLGFWVSSLLVGVVCMGVRRLVERRQPPRKP